MADGAVTSFAGSFKELTKGVLQAQWTAFAGVTTSVSLDAPNFPDKTLVATGTWGSATLIVEGSADASTWVAVNDLRGPSNAVSLAANGCVAILENPRYLRVKTTGGTGTSLIVTILCQSGRR